MGLIKRFKDFFNVGINANTDWFYLDYEEAQNICQDLMDDFGFNRDTGKLLIKLNSEKLDHIEFVLNSLAKSGKMDKSSLPIPIMGGPVLFKLEFNKIDENANYITNKNLTTTKVSEFYEAIEEVIDRLESTFPIELYDENAKSNRIVRDNNGELFWKFNPGTKGDPGTHKIIGSLFIANNFLLAFKLKNDYKKF